MSDRGRAQRTDLHSGYDRRSAVVRVPFGKTRITIRIDNDMLQWFTEKVHKPVVAIRRHSFHGTRLRGNRRGNSRGSLGVRRCPDEQCRAMRIR
jgi:hypothetical protein